MCVCACVWSWIWVDHIDPPIKSTMHMKLHSQTIETSKLVQIDLQFGKSIRLDTRRPFGTYFMGYFLVACSLPYTEQYSHSWECMMTEIAREQIVWNTKLLNFLQYINWFWLNSWDHTRVSLCFSLNFE